MRPGWISAFLTQLLSTSPYPCHLTRYSIIRPRLRRSRRHSTAYWLSSFKGGAGPRSTGGAAGREERERLAPRPLSKVGGRLRRFFGWWFWVQGISTLPCFVSLSFSHGSASLRLVHGDAQQRILGAASECLGVVGLLLNSSSYSANTSKILPADDGPLQSVLL